MKSLTILDVAEISGVGKSTVSRVINNDPNVKEETRKKVLKVIEETNFIPSKSARILRGKETKTIGVITTRLDSYSENRVIRGILKSFEEKNYEVDIMESLFSTNRTKKLVDNLLKRNVDAFIVFAIGNEEYKFLKAIDKPVVMIGQPVYGFKSITYDDYGAVQKVCDYLWENNKTKPAFIGVSVEDPTTGKERYRSYKEFTQKHHLKDISFFGGFSYEDGYKLAYKCIKEEIDSIVCATDNIALGVHKYLSENKIYDIIVTGIGDNKLVKFLYEDHITCKFFYKTSGVMASEMIDKILNNEDIEDVTVINSEFVS